MFSGRPRVAVRNSREDASTRHGHSGRIGTMIFRDVSEAEMHSLILYLSSWRCENRSCDTTLLTDVSTTYWHVKGKPDTWCCGTLAASRHIIAR